MVLPFLWSRSFMISSSVEYAMGSQWKGAKLGCEMEELGKLDWLQDFGPAFHGE